MHSGRKKGDTYTRVVILTADPVFDASVRKTFGASASINLSGVTGKLAGRGDDLQATVPPSWSSTSVPALCDQAAGDCDPRTNHPKSKGPYTHANY